MTPERIAQKERELAEMKRIFERASRYPGGVRAFFKALAEANKGQTGFGYSTLQNNYGKWKKGMLHRKHRGSEADARGRIDWRGWTPDKIRAVLTLADKTQSEVDELCGLYRGALSTALTGAKKGPDVQKTIDEVIPWAVAMLEAVVKELRGMDRGVRKRK